MVVPKRKRISYSVSDTPAPKKPKKSATAVPKKAAKPDVGATKKKVAPPPPPSAYLPSSEDEQQKNLEAALMPTMASTKVVKKATTTTGEQKTDFMVAANPMGKSRVVGQPKKSRKEQIEVEEQIQGGKELASVFGFSSAITTLPPKIPFMRSLRDEAKASAAHSKAQITTVPLQVQRVKDDTATTEEQATTTIIQKVTDSSALVANDYTRWDATQYYEDESLPEYERDAHCLLANAIKDYAQKHFSSHTAAERQEMAEAYFATECPYGRAAITMEDVSVLGGNNNNNGSYPRSTTLRCRYDHHCFDTIPILMPTRYNEPHNVLEVVPNMVFCSFSCLLAFVNREMPSMHANVRSDRVSLLHLMASKWFGICEPIRMAPLLEQHCDYGGRLTTAQFRALCNTHYSLLQYPIVVAVPARYVTEIYVSRKIDRAKRQNLNLRVAEQHHNVLPPIPLEMEIDSSMPAAPRGDEAKARARAKNDKRKATAAQSKRAKEEAEEEEQQQAACSSNSTATTKKKKLAGGSVKKHVVIGEDGEKTTVDRAYLENIIERTKQQQKKAPKKKGILESMMTIKTVSVDDLLRKMS